MQVQERIIGLYCLRMANFSISNAKYTYVHDQKYPSEAVDIHHVVVRKNGAKDLSVYILAILVLACGLYHYLLEASFPVSLFLE